MLRPAPLPPGPCNGYPGHPPGIVCGSRSALMVKARYTSDGRTEARGSTGLSPLAHPRPQPT